MPADFSWDSFDPATVQKDEYTALPPGTYRVLIKSAVQGPNKAGTGTLLTIKVAVADGKYKNRQLTTWVNLAHPKPEVVDIGKRELASICAATGVERPKNAAAFVGKLADVVLAVESYNGKDDNRVKRWMPKAKATAPATPPPADAAPATATDPNAEPPF